jgi:hypothetical protein
MEAKPRKTAAEIGTQPWERGQHINNITKMPLELLLRSTPDASSAAQLTQACRTLRDAQLLKQGKWELTFNVGRKHVFVDLWFGLCKWGQQEIDAQEAEIRAMADFCVTSPDPYTRPVFASAKDAAAYAPLWRPGKRSKQRKWHEKPGKHVLHVNIEAERPDVYFVASGSFDPLSICDIEELRFSAKRAARLERNAKLETLLKMQEAGAVCVRSVTIREYNKMTMRVVAAGWDSITRLVFCDPLDDCTQCTNSRSMKVAWLPLLRELDIEICSEWGLDSVFNALFAQGNVRLATLRYRDTFAKRRFMKYVVPSSDLVFVVHCRNLGKGADSLTELAEKCGEMQVHLAPAWSPKSISAPSETLQEAANEPSETLQHFQDASEPPETLQHLFLDANAPRATLQDFLDANAYLQTLQEVANALKSAGGLLQRARLVVKQGEGGPPLPRWVHSANILTTPVEVSQNDVDALVGHAGNCIRKSEYTV